MEKVNVLVGGVLGRELLERIASADSRINVLNNPQEQHGDEENPPFRFPGDLDSLLPRADVLFTSRLPRDLPERAPNLRWVQLFSAGVDVVFRAGYEQSGLTFTTASGVHPIPIAEWVVGAMLALVKRFPEAVHAQQRHEYWPYIPGELAGRTVGILGMGKIGQRIGRLCHALDMRVIGTRRSTDRPVEDQGEADLLVPPYDLPRLLSSSDFVVDCLPGTPETQGLMGEEQFKQMRRGACFLNIGRGSTVDEEALVRALQEGHLAGAALDVFAREPLPVDSPLWDMPNVLLTAHVSGNTPMYNQRATDLFIENLKRYLAGQPLLNVYDPERGY